MKYCLLGLMTPGSSKQAYDCWSLSTWLQWVGQRQLQDETRSIWIWGFGVPYIRYLIIGFIRYIMMESWHGNVCALSVLALGEGLPVDSLKTDCPHKGTLMEGFGVSPQTVLNSSSSSSFYWHWKVSTDPWVIQTYNTHTRKTSNWTINFDDKNTQHH